MGWNERSVSSLQVRESSTWSHATSIPRIHHPLNSVRIVARSLSFHQPKASTSCNHHFLLYLSCRVLWYPFPPLPFVLNHLGHLLQASQGPPPTGAYGCGYLILLACHVMLKWSTCCCFIWLLHQEKYNPIYLIHWWCGCRTWHLIVRFIMPQIKVFHSEIFVNLLNFRWMMNWLV